MLQTWKFSTIQDAIEQDARHTNYFYVVTILVVTFFEVVLFLYEPIAGALVLGGIILGLALAAIIKYRQQRRETDNINASMIQDHGGWKPIESSGGAHRRKKRK